MYSPSTQPAFALDAAASVYCYAPLIRTVPLPPTPSSPCFVPCGPHHLPSESVKGEPTDVALCRAPRMKTIPLPEAGNALGVHLYDSQLSAMDSGGDVTRTVGLLWSGQPIPASQSPKNSDKLSSIYGLGLETSSARGLFAGASMASSSIEVERRPRSGMRAHVTARIPAESSPLYTRTKGSSPRPGRCR